MGCGGSASDESAKLRRRAEELGDLLIRIYDMPERQATQALEGFIAPASDRADRIAQYLREFSATSEKYRIVSQSVTSIRIDPDRVNAVVTYQVVAQSPDGANIPVEQKTRWKRVGGKWYRTIGEAQKRLVR
jgi:hypothetical protein